MRPETIRLGGNRQSVIYRGGDGPPLLWLHSLYGVEADAAVIDRLTRRHPRIVFNVVIGGAAALYRNLAERNVELVMAGIGGPIPEEFDVEGLFDDSLVVAAGLQNPWRRRRGIELAELVNEPWTLLPPNTAAGALAVEAFRASGA